MFFDKNKPKIFREMCYCKYRYCSGWRTYPCTPFATNLNSRQYNSTYNCKNSTSVIQ